jgi:hypothetical protein
MLKPQIAIVCTTCGCTGVADDCTDREPAHSLRAKLKGRGWVVGGYSMKDRPSAGAGVSTSGASEGDQ